MLPQVPPRPPGRELIGILRLPIADGSGSPSPRGELSCSTDRERIPASIDLEKAFALRGDKVGLQSFGVDTIKYNLRY